MMIDIRIISLIFFSSQSNKNSEINRVPYILLLSLDDRFQTSWVHIDRFTEAYHFILIIVQVQYYSYFSIITLTFLSMYQPISAPTPQDQSL